MYKALHAYVRRNLRRLYGDEHISKTGEENAEICIQHNLLVFQIQCNNAGPVPAHVLGDMWGRFWNNLYKHMVPYPDAPSVDPSDELRKQASTTTF